MSKIILKADASVKEDNCVGIGYYIERVGDKPVVLHKESIPLTYDDLYNGNRGHDKRVDNAEFIAVLRGVEKVFEYIEDDESLKICTDSNNVARCVRRRQIRYGKENHDYLYEMLDDIYWDIVSIPRELNSVADSLSKHATKFSLYFHSTT